MEMQVSALSSFQRILGVRQPFSCPHPGPGQRGGLESSSSACPVGEKLAWNPPLAFSHTGAWNPGAQSLYRREKRWRAAGPRPPRAVAMATADFCCEVR